MNTPTKLQSACCRATLFPVAFVLSCAHAADTGPYPAKPIRLIVPFAPAGSADALARTIQPALSEALGQTLVIDNRPGASSTIGTDMAAKAAPDGYTLVLVTTTHTVNPSLIAKLPFDTVKDFAPVSLVVSQPNILVVHPSVAAKSVKELVAMAKAKPGGMNFASGGNGSSPHLSGELFNIVAGTRITHIPYKGSGPGVTDLLGGHVQMMFAGPLALEQHIKSGRLRPLALADKRRSTILPDVPTMAEAGVPGMEGLASWTGMFAPAKTPDAILARLHEEVRKAVATAALRDRLTGIGVIPLGSAPAEFKLFIAAQVKQIADIARAAGIEPQ